MAGSEYEKSGDVATADVAFARRWRGYDSAAVDAHLEAVHEALALSAVEIDGLRARNEELAGDAEALRARLADANVAAARASRSARVFDHIVRLARETARAIVAAAHDEAREVRTAARTAATEVPDDDGIDDRSRIPEPGASVEGASVEIREGDEIREGETQTANPTDLFDGSADADADADAVVAEPTPLFPEDGTDTVSIDRSLAAALFDFEDPDDDWSDFADSEAGRAFFADDAVDERARRWMLTG